MNVRSLCSFLTLTFLTAFVSTGSWALEENVSLGDLSRRERERKRNATQPARVITLEDKLLDCARNWDCLLAAVDRREEAQLQFTENIDLSSSNGTLHSSQIHIELRDFTEETVVLKAWPENSRLQYSARSREFARLQGIPDEAVELQERLAEKNLQRQDGRIITCFFKHDRLKQFISQVRTNPENDDSWGLAERCEGFDQSVLNLPPASQPQPPSPLPARQ